MTDLLMKLRISDSPLELNDDRVVEECMERLMEKYPQVKGYTWERLDQEHIQVLMWGDIEDDSC